ncbi:hypothetical protein GCM10010394_55710 [Streptomyces crystallinus]|uniref:Uncharacterized protein n=1 Tax=Streptomyces crystallinus TaxID=68191 RepID=A0ABP3RVW1_9ACTN
MHRAPQGREGSSGARGRFRPGRGRGRPAGPYSCAVGFGRVGTRGAGVVAGLAEGVSRWVLNSKGEWAVKARGDNPVVPVRELTGPQKTDHENSTDPQPLARPIEFAERIQFGPDREAIRAQGQRSWPRIQAKPEFNRAERGYPPAA